MLNPNPQAIEAGRVVLVILSGLAMFLFGVLVGAGVMAAITDSGPRVDNRPG
jgi:hypothetical protein